MRYERPEIERRVRVKALLGNGSVSPGIPKDLSDRNAKTGFAPVDVEQVLAGVVTLPLETWSYNSQGPTVRHIGPMAQDFAATFAVGEDDRHISMVDAFGVAIGAIQALNSRVERQAARIEELEMILAATRQESTTTR